MITTTLNKIREYSPCKPGWEKLLKNLEKSKADDDVLKFSTILESNGISDALWCLRSICPEYNREVRLFAADCAEAVLHIFEKILPNDKRPREAIIAARQFANGEITAAAEAAAQAAAWAATRDTAGAAARAAAWNAAWAAARAAAWDTAGDAAWDAAWAAAWAAAWDTAWAAAGAAARAAAWNAARDAQGKMLIERFS